MPDPTQEAALALATPEQLTFDILFDALPDIAMRDQRDGLERAWVSLGKNKRTTIIQHDLNEVEFVRVIPNAAIGMATIWDWDIIIFLTGQLMARAQDPNALPNTPAISVQPHAILTAIGRGTGGRDYAELRQAILRLQSTLVETNIFKVNKRRTDRYAFITGFSEDNPGKASSGGMTFVLPPWVIRSVKARSVLSIHRDYFSLSGGVERYLYRLARKMAGRQPQGARIGMEALHERSGSPMRLADFAKNVRRVVTRGAIPEYKLSLYKGVDGDEVLRMEPDTLSRLPPTTDL